MGEARPRSIARNELSVAKGGSSVFWVWTVRFGKSTLLNIIGGIDSADCGYISINGDKLEDMSEETNLIPQKTSRLCISDVQSDC